MTKQRFTVALAVATAITIAFGSASRVAARPPTPVHMEYGQPPGTVDRYAFSQRGWMNSSRAMPTKGNLFSGYVSSALVRGGDEAIFEMRLTDLAVSYILQDDHYLKQPSDNLVDVPLRFVTRPGSAPELDMAAAEAKGLPMLAGIAPSSLLMDLPTMLPALPPGPVEPGATWTAPESHEIVAPGRDGTDMRFFIDGSMTYTFESEVERPTGILSRETTSAIHVTGVGEMVRRSEGTPFGGDPQTERIRVEGYFDHAAGRWLEVTYTNESSIVRETNGQTMTMEMGYTNQFKYVLPR